MKMRSRTTGVEGSRRLSRQCGDAHALALLLLSSVRITQMIQVASCENQVEGQTAGGRRNHRSRSSGLKMSWKAEQWEQMLCVEERVPRRDAAAIELEDDQCPGRMAPARRGPILPEASCP